MILRHSPNFVVSLCSIIKKSNMRPQIEIGTPYQLVDGLLESTDQQTTDLLQLWANTGRFKKVIRADAIDMGFEELGEWSNAETDVLFLIDEAVLVAQNRKSLLEYNKGLNLLQYGQDS